MGEPNYNLVDLKFHHIVIEGTHYEVGNQLAEFLKQDPGAKQFFSSAKTNLKRLGFPDFNTLWDYCEECSPGLTDEIQGFADGLGVTPDKLPFWNWTFSPSLGGECSQLVLLSSVTKDEHIYVGRSYEWNHKEEDMKLFTTRVKGKASHIGFSCLLFGRHDGLNEHGLVVSMTGGGIFGVPFKHRGPMFWLPIRALLDQCTTVDHALECLTTLPLTGYLTLMFVDKQNNAAFVEVADGVLSVNQITPTDDEAFGFSVNHFRLPDMQGYNKMNVGIIAHSKVRESLITKWYQSKVPGVTKADVRALMASEHPHGLCNHFYNDGFGTLWSMIFDVTKGTVDACFSAPTHNKYRTFGLDDPVGITEYQTIVPISLGPLPMR